MIDTQIMDVKTTSMTTRIKRTYNLTPEAVAHVRAMAGRADLPPSQDAVVELAIDHLYRAVSDADDAVRWAGAAQDRAFLVEMQSVASDIAEAETRLPE